METNSSGDELLKTSSKETNCLEAKSRGTEYNIIINTKLPKRYHRRDNIRCKTCSVIHIIVKIDDRHTDDNSKIISHWAGLLNLWATMVQVDHNKDLAN